MLRPTNRITYEVSDADMQTILTDMQLFHENGIDGFVFGALKRDNWMRCLDIDIERCNEVIRNAHFLPVTFHRAIDMTDVQKRHDNLNIIERCGFKRILSSGFAETAITGIANLFDMQAFAGNRYIIMPGCGINASNVDQLLQRTLWHEFHASARVQKVPEIEPYDSDYQKKCLKNNPFYVTSEQAVRELVESGKRWDFRCS